MKAFENQRRRSDVENRMEQINRRESRTNDHKAFWLAVTILAWMLVVVAALGLAAVVFEVIAFMYPWIQAR